MRCFKVVSFLFALALCSCNSGGSAKQLRSKERCKKLASLHIKYARGFAVDYYSGFVAITVRDCADTSRIFSRYVLLPAGKPAPVGFEDAVLIYTPVGKIVCTNSLQRLQMATIGLSDSIAATPNPAGPKPSFALTPKNYDLGDTLETKARTLGLIPVLDLDYREHDFPGQFEWCKFIATFYGQELRADSIFNAQVGTPIRK